MAASFRLEGRGAGGDPGPPAVALPEAVPRGLRRPTLAFLAVALQAAPGLPGGHLLAYRHRLVVASGVVLAGWFVANLRTAQGALRAVVGVALVGAAMNLVVMVPNGGMPVSPAALRAAGAEGIDVTDGQFYKHRLLDDDTVLGFLGDVIPVRPLGMAASAGDVVLFAGIAGIALALVGRRRPSEG